MAERLISLIAVLVVPLSIAGTFTLGLIAFDGDENIAILMIPMVMVIAGATSWVITGDPFAWLMFWGDMIAGGAK